MTALPFLLLVRPRDERLVDLCHPRLNAETLFSPRLLVGFRCVSAMLSFPCCDLLRSPIILAMLRLQFCELPSLALLQFAQLLLLLALVVVHRLAAYRELLLKILQAVCQRLQDLFHLKRVRLQTQKLGIAQSLLAERSVVMLSQHRDLLRRVRGGERVSTERASV